MKVSGFTFLRNATLMGYCYLESIKSLLPLVDEYVINVGESDDDTLEQILALNEPKIKIIHSVWNDKMHSKGFVYAQQKMIAQYSCTGDWAFYLEGDEVLHEQDLEKIRSAMQKHLDNPKVEALIFNYYHLYGRPDQCAVSPAWYRTEARVIRNTIRTYAPDGLFWLVLDKNRRGRYPRAVHTGATIYHYGWVRSYEKMLEKTKRVRQYWGESQERPFTYDNLDVQALAPFTGQHPVVMRNWLENEAQHSFTVNPNYKITSRERKHRFAMKLEKWFGFKFGKKHYQLVG